VPRSYYLNASNLPGHKEPSQEDLRRLVARTEEQIRTGIALIVPLSGPGAWKTIIDMIPDEGPLNRPPIVSSPAESRRVALDWGIAAAMGAMAAALVTLGSWALSSRRPAGRLEPAPAGMRSHRGTVATTGPSERVREFVRRNPESAVSVLERWTSQGADHSVLGALSAPSASALRRSLEGLGPFRLSDAETAQAEIAERLRRLYDQGALSLPNPSGREEVLV
jgi:hypothetical protein